LQDIHSIRIGSSHSTKEISRI